MHYKMLVLVIIIYQYIFALNKSIFHVTKKYTKRDKKIDCLITNSLISF